MTNISASESLFVLMYQDRYQVAKFSSADRAFVENSTMASLVSVFDICIVEGLGEPEKIEEAIMVSHFGALCYVYGNYNNVGDSSIRMRYGFEWMIRTQSGRVVPWADFKVKQVSPKGDAFEFLKSSYAVSKSNVYVDETKISFRFSFIRTTDIPSGLALPPPLSLRLNFIFVDYC